MTTRKQTADDDRETQAGKHTYVYLVKSNVPLGIHRRDGNYHELVIEPRDNFDVTLTVGRATTMRSGPASEHTITLCLNEIRARADD